MATYEVTFEDGSVFELDGPDGLSQEEVFSAATRMYAENNFQPIQGLKEAPSFLDSIGQGVDMLQKDFGSLLNSVGHALDWEELKSAGLRMRERNEQELQSKDFTEPDWREIFEEDTISAKTGAALDYLVHQVGVNLPQILGLGAAGLAGGAVAGPIGAVTGATAMGTGIFTASNESRRADEGLDPALGQSFAYAVPQAAAETVFLGVLSKTGLSSPMASLLKHIPDGASKTVLGKTGEAIGVNVPSEVFQQALERSAAELGLTTPEAIEEYKDSIAGAIAVGGGLGATAGVGKVALDKYKGKEPKAVKEEPNLAEQDISEEPILTQTPEAPESSLVVDPINTDPLDFPVVEAPAFSEVTTGGKVFKEVTNLDEKTMADVIARRKASPIYANTKAFLGRALGLNEATKLYPEGIPDNILSALIPAKASVSLAKSRAAMDLVIDRINKESRKVMSRDEWFNLIDKNPFGKGKLRIPFRKQFNTRFPKTLNQISKQDVLTALEDIRAGVGLNERDMNPKAFPDEKLIPTRKKKFPARTSTALSTSGIVLDRALEKRRPNYGEIYRTTNSEVPNQSTPSVLNKDTLNMKLGEVKANPKPLSQLESAFKRVINEVGKKTQHFLGNVISNLQEGKRSLSDPARYVGLNLMSRIALQLADPAGGKYLKDNKMYSEEFWHFLHDSTDFFSDKDKANFENNLSELLHVTAKQGLLDMDVMNMGINEILAHVFADYVASKKDPAVETLKLGKLTPAFDRAFNLLNRLGQSMRGQGIKDVESLFEGDQISFDKALLDIREARTKQLGEAQKEKAIHEDAKMAYEHMKSISKKPSSSRGIQNLPHLFFFFNFWRTDAGMARAVPEYAPFVETFSRRENRLAEELHKAGRTIGKMIENRPNIVSKIGDVMNHLRQTGQKAEIDQENGRIIFIRDGKRVAINDSQFFKDFKTISEFFEEDLNTKETLVRESLGEYGMDADSSVAQIDRRVEEISKNIENQPDERIQKLMRADVEDLSNISAQLKSLNSLRKTQYIPQMRFGDYVVWVWDKQDLDEDTKKPKLKYHAQYEYSDNPFKEFNEEQFEKIKKDVEKKGYLSNPSRYKVVGLGKERQKVTYNKMIGKFPTPRATMEAIYGLLGGGYIDSYVQSVEDSLTKEQRDILTDLQGRTDTVANKQRDKILRRAKIKNMSRVFMKSENIDGYSQDWPRVLTAYAVGSAKNRVDMEFQGQIALLESAKNSLEAKGNIPKSFMDYINRSFDYKTNPANDYQSIRALNFAWTMGANVSTATLQFMNGPMAVVPAIMQWDSNPIRANLRWASGMKLLSTHFIFRQTDFKTGQTDSFGDRDLHKKLVDQGVLKELESKTLLKLYDKGIIDSMFAQEYTGKPSMVKAEQSGLSKGFKDFGRFLGLGISIAEQGGRFASSKAIVSSFLNEDGSINKNKMNLALELYKENGLFVEWQKQNSDMTLLEALTSFILLETHGLYDKSGRGTLQRGIAGAALTPFMTHPTTQIELLGNLALRRGGKGKLGAVYMLSTYMVMGGLMAMPAAELIKEIYDFLEELYSGSKDDLALDIQRVLVESGTMTPKAALAFTKGLVRAYTPTDVSSRMNLPMPFQSPLIAFLNLMSGEKTDLSRMLGPSVGIVEGAGRAVTQRNPSEMLPVAIKNASKGLIAYRPDDSLFGSGEGAMTRSGNRLVRADEFTTTERLLKAFGFSLSKEGNARDMMYSALLEDTGFRKTQSRLTKEIARELEKMIAADNAGNKEKAELHRKNVAAKQKQLFAFLQNEGIPLTKDKVRGVYTSTFDRTKQLINPDISPFWSKSTQFKADNLRKIYQPDKSE